jgi:hypothetical protein
MSIEELQNQHEAELATTLAGLSGKSRDSDWALARALVHKAVHLVAERQAAEYCALATLLAEMIGHAHGLMHPPDSRAPAHGAIAH